MSVEEKEKIEKEELNKNNNVQNVEKEAEVTKADTKKNKNQSKDALPAEKKEASEINVDQESSDNELDSKNEDKNENKKEDSTNVEVKKQPENNFNQTAPQYSIGHLFFKVVENVFFILITLLALAFTIFTIVNTDNSKISSGVSILGIDVSGLERETATNKVSSYVQETLENNDIILKHNEFETNIGPEQIEAKINVSSAIDAAFEVGSASNIFTNSFKKLSLLVNPVDIKPTLSINTEQLNTTLSDISTQLPDAVKQSDFYIDGNNLIVTAGKSGVVIDNNKMIEEINSNLFNLSYKNTAIDIVTINKEPDELNIEDIYNQVHKDAVDARFDAQTHIVYPEEKGLDFNISLEEAKAMLTEKKEEYVIPLKTLKPNITTNMIGMEAFPHLLSSFSTRYPASNRDRTTNLKLAASKVNGTVVLPGQTFSYNAVVGERTIAAGYKEAAVYQDGQVVQGLGGGICQISSTLYNAALYANLDIVERRNHQFVPSYVGAGRDATVVYGSQDFKFKNNRNYAIKITCSVDKGIATFNIYGLQEDSDCEVTITSGITSRGANSFTSATYKTLKKNGQVISSTTVSRDTYKMH